MGSTRAGVKSRSRQANRSLDRIHRSAQGPEQKSFLEVAGKPDAKFIAERQRARQVIAQLRLGEVRLALRDCIHDRLMIPHDLSGLAPDGKVQTADAIDVTAAF